MSGIIGLVHFDGCPVDRRLLSDLTESMAHRGPDGSQIWTEGSVGFGLAWLATGEDERAARPLSLDGEVWIVADARIDGRRELITELASRGCVPDPGRACDAELILHAYRLWGEEAAEHLLGDFAFAIWDRRQRRLYCARDHFGVKPFYYAEWPEQVVFGNSLRCLRRHPAVSAELDRRAVADYLLFNVKLDPGATTFSGIHRLPAAHSRSWSPERRGSRRYWSLPLETTDEEPGEGWVERFSDVFRRAVADRLRGRCFAVEMSGGLDSSSVAAVAHEVLKGRGRPFELHCHTLSLRELLADDEGRFASLVARRLETPIHLFELDGYRVFERWGELPVAPEPRDHFMDAITYDFGRRIEARARVVLTGFGGDSLLLASRGYFVDQLASGRFAAAARYLGSSLARDRRLPPLGLHTRWCRWRLRRTWRSGYPTWLDPDLESEHSLEDRWRWATLERRPDPPHPRRPEAHRDLWEDWTDVFERGDPDSRGVVVERLYPLFDIRLVELVLGMPPVPWFVGKELLREAMRGLLPEEVRRRPKAPLAGVPNYAVERSASSWWRELAGRAPEIGDYVQPRKVLDQLIREEAGNRTRPYSFEIQRPVSLAYWLASC